MANSDASVRPSLDEQADSIFEWIQSHTRHVAIAAAGVVVIGSGVWLYGKNRQVQAQRAEESLVRAQQSLQAGNPALAKSDLEKVAKRYGGTPAGRQAALLLAEVYYRTGEYQKGITELSGMTDVRDDYTASIVEGQLAAGYEQLKKYPEAADHYKKAAERARFPTDSLTFMASAARAYGFAGNTAEATRLWTELATDQSSPVAGEARVRLGELKTQPAKRS